MAQVFEFTALVEIAGARGKSAYQIAVDNGYVGSVQNWLDSLKPGDYFVFDQQTPIETVIIAHNMNRFPSVTVVDSGGTVVVGGISYIDQNNIQLSFSSAFAFKAYLN